MSRRARAFAEATAAKRIALLPVESEPEVEYDDTDRTCPQCDGDGGDKWSDYMFECPMCGGEGVLS